MYTGQKIESLSIRICNHVVLVLLLDKYTNAEQKLNKYLVQLGISELANTLAGK